MAERQRGYGDNRADYRRTHVRPEYCLYVGDLSNDVDDSMLYYAFKRNYPSLYSAKVTYDTSGTSGKNKNYGIVRFDEELDQQKALIEMQHIRIGRRTVKVSLAAPKRTEAPGTSESVYYSQYNSTSGPNQYHWGGYTVNYNTNPCQQEYQGHYQPQHDDEVDPLEDPQLEVDVEKENREFMISSEAFFNALDQSRWHPIDHVTSQLHPFVS
ncbi:hypothetical protein LOTGIDRAFT_234570 [Lottia gigantea]|uniref:tRNA selenocysteine-associated protein 1 n=1 Tax=Lottia gigantea TaxID=225164 RepID=V4BHK0_LOTGI|nr:hypothetical protein LOTGIDRAFT_234570 [Lottia gigantea]ESO88234.1 hypothetical protein LOTGIDRAFT_234570 [Lottia gigantea]